MISNLTIGVIAASVTGLHLINRILSKDEYSPWYTKYFGILRPKYPFDLDYEKGYEGLVEIFKKHFQQGIEVGASVTVYSNGNKAVDCYGGYQDFNNGIPFTKDTLSTVYSSTKFMTAMVMAKLVDEGLLNYDDKVTKYWPEFGQNGKENVTIADVLRHDGGVPYFEGQQPGFEEAKNPEKLRTFFENQRHIFDGKPERAYHGITRGFILNEIVRRVHPKEYSIGQIHKQIINPTLGIQFTLGLDRDLQHRRAYWYTYPKLDLFTLLLPKFLIGDKKYTFNKKLLSKDALVFNIMKFRLGRDKEIENTLDFSDIEAPSSNGFTNSYSLATTAAFMANKGSLNNIKLMSETAVNNSIDKQTTKHDHCILQDITMSQGGFGVFTYPELGDQFKDTQFYGWFGAGGSMVVFNTEYNFAFSYVMNAQHFNGFFEGRAHRLFIEAFKVHIKNIKQL